MRHLTNTGESKMTLYPPALVREAFFHLCQTEGATPSGIASAYRADRSSTAWHYEAQSGSRSITAI
jgi:hypothetical protein